ncbi:hypothetical protein GCM10023116_20270 [Kistimonas scapharcae]|uniref:Uncharacterized protein n=1 Tax=Kistimonas scapharcae TaxID=1036133 RepID=A0ABP8V1P8_9GAMM
MLAVVAAVAAVQLPQGQQLRMGVAAVGGDRMVWEEQPLVLGVLGGNQVVQDR